MTESISDIKKIFQTADPKEWSALCAFYSEDGRDGVARLVASYEKKTKQLEQERRRLQEMTVFERRYRQHDAWGGDVPVRICGIDEVGRGPLAGPVVAGAVILPEDCEILYLNDSKKLSEKKRVELDREIREKALAVGIGVISHERIDEINILNATYEAMRMAVRELGTEPDILLNDAVTIPEITIPQVPIIKGDAKSVSIAAASIVAKVYRDDLMTRYDELYPEYHFSGNKGYGSSEHIEAIRKYGPCPIHRRTFIRNFIQ